MSYNLYRSAANSDVIDYGTIVGTANDDAQVITTAVGMTHEPSSYYWYAIRAVNAFGTEETNTTVKLKVTFDENGEVLHFAANSPFGLQARAISKDRTEVVFRYDPAGELASPAAFKIYVDNVAQANIVRYEIGVRVYRVIVEHGNSESHVFRVRSITSENAEDSNANDVTVGYDLVAPLAAGEIIVETIN
jgi:hypothetical protein